jgi:radical SAM protein with 4Fe4S-binding SPASM domain
LSRFPYIIDWAVTSKCNLDCRHCRGMVEEDLPTERARTLIGEIAELKPGWVIVEGGEPFLRRDLLELISLMRDYQLDVHLITNGTQLDYSLLPLLKQLGIKVMVSIDGATPVTYEAIRKGGSFEAVVESARRYAEAGLLEAINFAILKQNYREIPGIFSLAASLGTEVTLIGLKPCHYYPEALLTPGEYEEAIRLTCQAAEENKVQFFFDEPFFWSAVREWGLMTPRPEAETGILVSSTNACIFGKYLFLEPNGDVRPCSFAPMVLDNVKDKTLGEVWDAVLGSDFFHKIEDPKSRTGHCQQCQYLEDCLGCRSRSFALTGDWFAADPACPLGGTLNENSRY